MDLSIEVRILVRELGENMSISKKIGVFATILAVFMIFGLMLVDYKAALNFVFGMALILIPVAFFKYILKI